MKETYLRGGRCAGHHVKAGFSTANMSVLDSNDRFCNLLPVCFTKKPLQRVKEEAACIDNC